MRPCHGRSSRLGKRPEAGTVGTRQVVRQPERQVVQVRGPVGRRLGAMAKTGDIRAVTFGASSILLVGASLPVPGLLEGYPVLTGQAIRYAIGGLILLGVLLVRGKRLPMPGLRDLAGILGMVIAGMLGFNAAILVAERYAM